MTKCDLLLVNPSAQTQVYQSLSSNLTAIEPPIWLGLLAKSLRKQFNVEVMDCIGYSLAVEDAVAAAGSLKPRLIAVVAYGQQPSASTQHMVGARLFIKSLKENYPDLPIVLVGGHPSSLPQKTLIEEQVDFVAQGEGLKTLEGLLNTKRLQDIPGLWYLEDGVPRFTSPAPMIAQKDLATEMPGVAYDLLPMINYRAHNWHAFGDLENRTYSMMEIDLDLKMDDQGNTPGSYIKTKSNSKLMLNSNTSDDSKVTLFIDKDSKVDAGDDNDFIIDLDLRKCIKQESNGDYAFVSNTELKNSLRIMERDEANTLKGKVNAGAFNNYDNVVAYIYAKGKFKMEEETKESGEDKIRFRNAVSSSVLTDSDEYNFHFIEDGQYELHFFGYNDDDKDGKFELKAMLKTSSSGSVETDNIDISGNSNTTLDLSVTGVLDII